jgi:hypothetical protein
VFEAPRNGASGTRTKAPVFAISLRGNITPFLALRGLAGQPRPRAENRELGQAETRRILAVGQRFQFTLRGVSPHGSETVGGWSRLRQRNSLSHSVPLRRRPRGVRRAPILRSPIRLLENAW